MSDESKKRSRKWIGWALLAAVMLYTASMGPAWWLVCHSGTSIHTFSVAYRPFALLRRARPVRDVTDWYLDVWVPSGD
jgi:hypothetical protein